MEDIGDRGDTYDFDPVEGAGAVLVATSVLHRTHVTGVEELEVRRDLMVPACLDATRNGRASETVLLTLTTVARLVPGTGRVDVDVTVDNTAQDHRLRLLFPTGETEGQAMTTFDVIDRTSDLPDSEHWMHPATATFPQQGWVQAGGLTVGAPGPGGGATHRRRGHRADPRPSGGLAQRDGPQDAAAPRRTRDADAGRPVPGGLRDEGAAVGRHHSIPKQPGSPSAGCGRWSRAPTRSSPRAPPT